MKKIVLIIAAVLVGLASATAQPTAKLSAKVGLGLSNMYGSGESVDPIFAYRMGLGVDIKGSSIWGFQTGLNFENIGASEDMGSISGKINAMYLEVPLMVTAGVRATDEINVIFNAGPYLAVGVGGKTKLETSVRGYDISEKVNTFGDTGMKRFDMGIGLGAMMEIKEHYLFGLDFRVGCLNIAESSGDDKVHNYAGFLTFGYRF